MFQNKSATTVLHDTSAASKFPVKSTYRIQPRDILQIRNLQNIKYIVDDVAQSSSGVSGSGTAGQGQTFEVDEDGTVALPAIGHIAVSGLTRVEATRKIEGLYRKELLKDPIIELKITNLKVTILGESVAQGNFPLLKDNTTLVEMIGQAGGLTKSANEKNVKIIRGTGTNKSVTEIDLSDISSISDPRAILQNGDIIYIAQNKRAIRSDKLQNINTYAQPVTLLLSTALIIYSLSRQ
ncbi:polysaccharide biosynthesis/export family protein [Mucilaginibacter terrenus]|uniref:polysaccharide biosynthesis/export family protein n=1 Tax=Mucilaginibacter terrenus TaxID=2482727 RepID=UPI001401BEA7|nr:polysaccharide biosynthesis/export family protein [Mucilaginibacter terrenus]